MVQIILWIVLGLLAVSAASFVFKLGAWLISTALFLVWAYAMVDILLLSGMSLGKKALWAVGATVLPVVGPLGWLAFKPSSERLLN